MASKQPNSDIRCNVKSCSFNCSDQDFCSLHSIHVDACSQGSTGKPQDESACGSYQKK
jgi:hypothetical protein